MVLHTLVIDPDEKGKGYGREFVAFLRGVCVQERLYLPAHGHQRPKWGAGGCIGTWDTEEAGIVPLRVQRTCWS